jgi:8-oxo-dGTP pyrophosphatase MutT (NUDIX family)
MEKKLKQATLCFLVKEDPVEFVLLGMKKRGFGSGKLNGFGGKVEPGETIEEAVIRELWEESGVNTYPESIERMGELTFIFPSVPEDKKWHWDQVVHVFLVRDWEGEPKESEEMAPVWFNVKHIPFDKMWQDDKHWLPMILCGKKIVGKFVFGEDNEKLIDVEIDEAEF